MPTTTLTPGPELDAAIAKACGYEQIRRVEGLPLMVGLPSEIFSPSTDLNAAFEAARRVFANIFIHYNNSGSFWEVRADTRRAIEDDCRFYGTDNELNDESLPLALCSAILSLKGAT